MSSSTPTILLIEGSFRNNGFNHQLSQVIASKLEGKAEVRFLDYQDLPFVNEDLENPELEVVARIRQEFREANGLWFVSPEYNFSYPAQVKNLIDWMSRMVPGQDMESVVIRGKKTTISGAGGSAFTLKMQEKLTDLLEFLSASVMTEPKVAIQLPAESWASGDLILSPENVAAIDAQVEAFLSYLAQ